MVATRSVIKVVVIVVVSIAILYLLYRVRNVLAALVVAVFVAVALAPLVNFLQRRTHMPRAVAILVTYVGLLLAVFGIGLLLVPPIVDEVETFAGDVPSYVQEIRQSDTLREYDDKYKITQKLQDQAETLPSRLGDAAGALQSVTVGVFSAIFQLIIVTVMSIFILLDGRRWIGWIFRQMGGPEREERARRVAQDISSAVGGYVAGALAIALLAGVSTFLMLEILGVPFAVPLAVLMAFCALIPLVGATIAGVIIGFVCLFENFPTTVIVWTVFLIAYQQVESHVLQPQIYRRTVNLHPLLVIVAVLVGASLLGILGALLAIPAAATFQILLREWWEYREERAAGDVVLPDEVEEREDGTEAAPA